MMNSSVLPSCDFRSITKASALPGYISIGGLGPTSTVGNVKIARSGISRPYYCYVSYSLVFT